MHPSPPRPTSQAAILIAAGLLVLGAVLAYANSFSVPFIYDDTTAIVTNPTIRKLWPLWPVLNPPATLTTSGRPLVNLSLAINYALGGDRVWGYHALNLAIHVCAGLALFGIVRRTALQPALRDRFGAAALLIAFTIAAIWIVHPLQTESVTYLVQRAESLMSLFYLLTLYCFIRGTDSDSANIWFSFSIGCCFLGMASKEVMVSAPLLVLLYDRTFIAGSFRAAWQQRRHLYVALAVSWFLLGALVASTGGTRDGSAGFGHGMSSWVYALTQLEAITRYLGLSFWPHPLVFDYGIRVVEKMSEAIPFALVIGPLVAVTLVGLKRWPVIGFVGLWFFALLAPSSSVVPVVTETIAEHRMYLPLAAVVSIIVFAAYAWVGRLSLYVLLATAIVLGGFTLRRNEDYRSTVRLWSDTVAKRPENPRAHNQLGFALFAGGREAEAMQHYVEALRLKPTDPDAHYNLATAFFRWGQLEDAAAHFAEAVRLKPAFGDAHNNYGLVLVRLGRGAEATQHYREALRLNPRDTTAYNNLGVAIAQAGQLVEATQQFKAALQINPGYTEAHNNLGNAYRLLGQMPAAVAEFETVLRLNPDYTESHNSLALVLDDLGQTEQAAEHFRQVVRLAPDYPEGHYNLGNALARLGRVAEAIAQWEETLRLKPDHAPAREKLAQQGGLAPRR